jgi:hypothetical protein
LKESALNSALEDIQKLKSKTEDGKHGNGVIDVYSGKDLSIAVQDAWLVIEVRYNKRLDDSLADIIL